MTFAIGRKILLFVHAGHNAANGWVLGDVLAVLSTYFAISNFSFGGLESRQTNIVFTIEKKNQVIAALIPSEFRPPSRNPIPYLYWVLLLWV